MTNPIEYHYDPTRYTRRLKRAFQLTIDALITPEALVVGLWIRDWDGGDANRDLMNKEFRHLMQIAMRITPDIETYFLSFLMTQDVRSNVRPDHPDYRVILLEVANKMQRWDHSPDFLKKLRRAYQEAGTSNDNWFFEQLAEAYLRWLLTQQVVTKTA